MTSGRCAAELLDDFEVEPERTIERPDGSCWKLVFARHRLATKKPAPCGGAVLSGGSLTARLLDPAGRPLDPEPHWEEAVRHFERLLGVERLHGLQMAHLMDPPEGSGPVLLLSATWADPFVAMRSDLDVIEAKLREADEALRAMPWGAEEPYLVRVARSLRRRIEHMKAAPARPERAPLVAEIALEVGWLLGVIERLPAIAEAAAAAAARREGGRARRKRDAFELEELIQRVAGGERLRAAADAIARRRCRSAEEAARAIEALERGWRRAVPPACRTTRRGRPRRQA